MAKYANVDKLMKHSISLDWSILKWVNEVDISTSINPNVVEVKHGRWYKPKEYPRDSYRYICTVCQEVAYFVTGNNGKKHKEDYPRCGYKFCPNCGADMRKETEDAEIL